MGEVMVTSGATEALTGSIPGPRAARRRSAAIPANVRFLRADHPAGRRHSQIPSSGAAALALPKGDPRCDPTPKTRYVILNNPLNPAAVVYPREDLEMLGRIYQEHNPSICDEVWEHVVFDGREHIPLITIPGMRIAR
jgi:histidinol-phosphate/aromatic aminotransferase/cobyric acid decarboxylase-like protein